MSARNSFRKLAVTNGLKTTNFVANPALATSYNLTLPSTVPTLPGQSLISDTSGNLSWGSSTGVVSTFTGTTNPLTTPTNVTGLLFTATSSTVTVYISINASTNLYFLYTLKVYQKGSTSSWGLAYDYICDTDDQDPQILFTVTSTGQIQYTMPNTIAGFTSAVMFWTLGNSVSNTLTSLSLTSNLNVAGPSTFTAGIQGTSLALSSTLNVAGPSTFTAGIQGTSLALSSTFNVTGLATHSAMTGLSLVLGNAIGSGTVSSTIGTFLNVQAQTYTDTGTAASSTAAGSFSASYLGIPTLTATNTAVTTGTASTLTIAGPPVAGTNETITNLYALNVLSGVVRLAAPILSPNQFNGTFGIPQITQAFASTNLTFSVTSGNMTLTNNNQAVSILVTGRYAISLNFDINTANITELVIYVNTSGAANRLINRYNGGSVFPDVRLSCSVNTGLNQGDLVYVYLSTSASTLVQSFYGRGLTVDLISRTA